ncbi:putative transcription regulator IWS1 family [Dioscorea sansibarensis]
METLYITGIGKAVNDLRRRAHSKTIQRLALSLILGWRSTVDEWISATSAIASKECYVILSKEIQQNLSSLIYRSSIIGNSQLELEKSLPFHPLDDEASQGSTKSVFEKSKESEEALVGAQFERTKRKLRQIYEENAKRRRRTIPLLKLDEIPKTSLREHYPRPPMYRGLRTFIRKWP